MNNAIKGVYRSSILFMIGGLAYYSIEFIYRNIMGRSPSHWSMFVLGGLLFIIIGGLNEYVDWEMPFWLQDIIGTIITVILEFVFGCVLNLWLGLDVWDYSNLPFNILGQICPQFTAIWMVLVAFAIVFDDYIRYLLFDEEKPVYYWKFQK